jgi:hypothetical protein
MEIMVEVALFYSPFTKHFVFVTFYSQFPNPGELFTKNRFAGFPAYFHPRHLHLYGQGKLRYTGGRILKRGIL